MNSTTTWRLLAAGGAVLMAATACGQAGLSPDAKAVAAVKAELLTGKDTTLPLTYTDQSAGCLATAVVSQAGGSTAMMRSGLLTPDGSTFSGLASVTSATDLGHGLTPSPGNPLLPAVQQCFDFKALAITSLINELTDIKASAATFILPGAVPTTTPPLLTDAQKQCIASGLEATVGVPGLQSGRMLHDGIPAAGSIQGGFFGNFAASTQPAVGDMLITCIGTSALLSQLAENAAEVYVLEHNTIPNRAPAAVACGKKVATPGLLETYMHGWSVLGSTGYQAVDAAVKAC